MAHDGCADGQLVLEVLCKPSKSVQATVLPLLPDEVWFMILDLLLVRSSHELSLANDDHSLSSVHRNFSTMKRTSLARQCIPFRLVSRNWCRITAPLFWKVVIIRDRDEDASTPSKLAELRHTLQTSLGAKNDPQEGLGRFVHELYLDTFKISWTDLHYILDACRYLRSLSITTRLETDDDLNIRLIKNSDTLRHFQYHVKGSAARRTQISVGILQATNQSNILSLSLAHPSGIAEPFLRLKRIVALALEDVETPSMDAIATWDLPSLKVLSINARTNACHVYNVLQTFGNQITYLELSCGLSSGSDWDYVRMLIKLTPNLQELVVSASAIQLWIRAFGGNGGETQSTITHFGIRDYRWNEILKDALERVFKLNWTSPQCFRVLGEKDRGTGNLSWYTVADVLKKYQTRGIIVEDELGANVVAKWADGLVWG